MSRVLAEALVLVNWKGVFYERYALDRHVTALEGDNGAGKTTVMIAAYVVLLPDMSRLRFTNLGETGATGGDKGIWGRLGEPGRPAYAAMQFRLPRGERLLAGVHLERQGEPTVEPTPFLVTGLRDDVRLQDLLLLAQGDLEVVPELPELRDNAGRLGARLQVFSSAKDYFGALFEHGVTAMRLGNDEERNKLNEMLKTSMTGGMSKGLLQELRSFLLKEEAGLAETLHRMRANLDACRRTRTEVAEAQTLEREIGSVYEAGEEMFAAAVAATRQRAEEMARRVAEKEAERIDAETRAAGADSALTTTRAALAEAEAVRVLAIEEEKAASAWETRVGDALHWAGELRTRASALSEAVTRRDAAEGARTQAENALTRASEGVERASEARERAAAGLADLQKGLEELHRRADAHRRVTERLATARRLLDAPDLDAAATDRAADETQRALKGVDQQRRDLSRRIDDDAAHRAEHAEAMAALTLVLERGVRADEALDAARGALVTVSGWRVSAARRASLAEQVRAAEADASRQAAAVERARKLELVWSSGAGRAAVRDALEASEQAHTAAEARARDADAAGADAQRRLVASQESIGQLEARAIAWRALEGKARTVAQAAGAPVSDRPDLDRARRTLQARLDTQRDEAKALARRRDALLTEAGHLRHAGGSFPAELLTLRDDLTADLLASHFDDVGLDEAAEIEALLGPLAQALVVPDVEAAARRLGPRPATLPTVWLVAEDAALSLDPDGRVGTATSGDVLVREREALRVTRLPDRPTLGRAARERRAASLEDDARRLEPDIERLRAEERETLAVLTDADALLEGASTWLLGDPASELDDARRLAAEAEDARRAARDEGGRSREEAARIAPRVRALRDLLPEAGLLDAPDLTAAAARLRHELADAEQAAAALARVGDAPATLERRLDALRHAPWSEGDLETARERLAALDGRRDRLAEVLEALRYVATNGEALAWTDASTQLEANQGLVPALEAQLESAKTALATAQTVEADARDARDEAASAFNGADAAHSIASARWDEATRRLAEIGVEEPSPALLQAARARSEAAREAVAQADERRGQLLTDVGRKETEAAVAAGAASKARANEEDERRQARPALEGWERLAPQLESVGLLGAALSERFQQSFAGKGSVNLYPHAQGRRDLLLERLASARGGPEVLSEVRRWLEATDQTTGEGYLRAWLIVRDWLRARLPAQIAEVDEPLAALERFRDHLARLMERLGEQERALRGDSEGVANGIDVQLRRARGRVQRLDAHLHGVRFGSIQGIRVKTQRVERMEQVLQALRSGEAQELLFQAGLPFEDALDEIFRRFGGGRTGGQRLLDYREYLHLQVEVLRDGGSDWEVANPTRLSTGEAIGVGAALMMVVLTEWERDANLLRGRRAFGSMRFLFLDEANRLDQANLGTVFDLCRNLDLQLLVAAPEVARAEGCTVFRLVRARGDDGGEQVIVSGRRVVGEA